jgi:carbamoyltransferase
VSDNGTFFIDQKLFDFEGIRMYPFNDAFTRIFGPPRAPESIIQTGMDSMSYYCDIAASVQLATENAILRIVANAVKQSGIKNVCLSGGVALNSAANGRIIRELGYQLFVQPAAGDAGGAIGAALAYSFQHGPDLIRKPMSTAQIGRVWSDNECKAALDQFYVKIHQEFNDNASRVSYVAQLLAQGKTVGWFQGAAEVGPRALGGRSILADPRGGDTQARVNEKIKFREQFRPFAPAVLAEKAHLYFVLDREPTPSAPESFMLAIAKVKEQYRSAIPAVTHIDGSARLQTVFRQQSHLFYDLIEAFETYSGIPILLNTSFNLRGKPIVGSPQDAVETFLYSGLDVLALGPYIVEKKL